MFARSMKIELRSSLAILLTGELRWPQSKLEGAGSKQIEVSLLTTDNKAADCLATGYLGS